MNKFDGKDPAELVVLTFDFSPDLAPDETVQAVRSLSITAAYNLDANPAALLNGAAVVQGNKVLQPIQGGIDQVDYTFSCTVTTNNPAKVLTLAGLLPVYNAT